MRRGLQTRLMAALRPIEPTRQERIDAVARLRQEHPRAGKHFDGAGLYDDARGVVG